MLEGIRLLESASLGISDATNRIEEYLPEAEVALTVALRDRGPQPRPPPQLAQQRTGCSLGYATSGTGGGCLKIHTTATATTTAAVPRDRADSGVGHDVAGAV